MKYQKERLLEELEEVRTSTQEISSTAEIEDIRTVIGWFIDGVSTDVIRNYEEVAHKIDKIKKRIAEINS